MNHFSLKLHMPQSQLALMCLKLMIKNYQIEDAERSMAHRYNSSRYHYNILGIYFADIEDYNAIWLKRSHLRMSISFLLHLALMKYLKRVMNEILDKNRSSKIYSNFDLSFNYNHKTRENSKSGLIFEESYIIFTKT